MSGIICSACGRDLDEIGQCNMSCTREPLCEDCWHGTVGQQGHAGAAANPLRVREDPWRSAGRGALEAEAAPAASLGPVEVEVSVDPGELREAIARDLSANPWWSALKEAAL